jgi:transcriptional regulator with XRE-family HTH domain
MVEGTMSNYIGEEIYRNRKAQKLTQDQYGLRFSVSGPAIFKFEKGFVRPSLKLWLEISEDLKIPERKAVLMWIKDRLPDKFQHIVDVKNQKVIEEEPEGYEDEFTAVDYATIPDRKRLRKTALADDTLPRGLRSFIRDDEIWTAFKPTGDEINFLRDTFGKFPRAKRALFREALILHRAFSGKD